MEDVNSQLNPFICRLYTSTAKIDNAEYRDWALSQLQELIHFDGAIWSNGHQKTSSFHNHTLLNVPESLTEKLVEYLSINPLADVLLSKLGSPVDMKDLVTDEKFYQSEIYIKCFQPLGIERILSSVHLDELTGLFTLLTLYRFDRDKPFTYKDKWLQQNVLFHLLSASKHSLFLQLAKDSDKSANSYKAICDKEGYYHEVQTLFIETIALSFPSLSSSEDISFARLPIQIDAEQLSFELHGLQFLFTPFNDLYIVEVWILGPLDRLTAREKDVVYLIEQGLTFKQVAKELSISPSTVSNHLYRVYHKLNIGSKSELIKLLKG